MADFCKTCSLKEFGEDFGDLAGITTEDDMRKNSFRVLLCEGCGPIQVDPEGRRLTTETLNVWRRLKGLSEIPLKSEEL